MERNYKHRFGSEKLTREEFSKKYWKSGEFPYQFHTPRIEEGRDEREQFIFNDLRALRGLISYELKQRMERDGKQEQEIRKLKVGVKVAFWMTLLAPVMTQVLRKLFGK